MATISSFRTALSAPRSYFSALAGISCLEERILRSTYFAEMKVECDGRKMLIYMPLSAVSLRRAERFLPLKRHLADPVVPHLTLLREEMRWVDAVGRTTACDILCEPLPAGLPFADALATIADDEEAAQIMDALDELQARLLRADVSHNNIREENIVIGEDYRLWLVRWYYATDGAGGDAAAFDALRGKVAAKCEGMALREPDFDGYNVAQPLDGHLSVRLMREGLAAVEDATGWGFVDSDNRIVVEPKYEWVSDFRESRAEVQTAEGMGLIDKHGEYIILPRYKIVEYDAVSGCSQVFGEEGWMVFDYEGVQLQPLECEQDISVYPPPKLECEIV